MVSQLLWMELATSVLVRWLVFRRVLFRSLTESVSDPGLAVAVAVGVGVAVGVAVAVAVGVAVAVAVGVGVRSEERRVGEEGGPGGRRWHEKWARRGRSWGEGEVGASTGAG